MKNKILKFQDGGISDENFTPEQLKFLGGADRTDPYILARMRKAAPDAPKTAKLDTKVNTKLDAGEIRDEFGEKSSIRKNTETGELYDTAPSVSKEVKKTTVKNKPKEKVNKKINPESGDLYTPVATKKNTETGDNYTPVLKRNRETGEFYESVFKSGGKVSSASKRADGCAVRGKTRA